MAGRDLLARLMLAAAFGLLAIVWSGLLARSHLSGRASVLDRIEAPLLDLRFLIAGTRKPPPDLIIVALDDETVQEAGRFPLPRATLADLVSALTRLDARVIAVDLLFIDPGPPEADEALARSLRDAKAVIAAAGRFRENQAATDAPSIALPIIDRVIWPLDAFRVAAAAGLVNVTTDHAGTPRHVPLLLRSSEGLVPSFPLQAASRAKAAEATVDVDRITIGAAATRMDLGLNLPLRFYGPRGTIPTISARAVLRGEVDRSAISGRTVIVGATALGTSDTFATPFDPVLPGVEVLATAVGHLMAGDGLIRDRRVRQIDVAVALLLAVGAVMLICLAPLGPALLMTVLAVGLWLAFVVIAFGAGYWFSAVIPLAAFSVPAVLCAGARQALDRRQTRRLASAEEALRRFQSPVLADLIARNPAFLSEPVQQEAPILFVDLSNFTRMSERLGPARTRELLREFHSVVEDEVTAHGGLVLNFMGDGAMIVFGLPRPKADDASRAVEAATGLATEVRNWLAAVRQHLPEDLAGMLDVRVGGHYGPVVLSRLGTETHQHITVAGDSVNVTSRLLEVAARQRASVVVSAELLGAAGERTDTSQFGEMRSIAIRGREQPLTIALWLPQDRRAPALRHGT